MTKYIGFVEGPSAESTRQFVQHIIDGAGVQMLAIAPVDIVVGCGRGLGKQLAVHTIEAARRLGIERVELEVFASNRSAIALYLALGFVTEGTKRRARKLDGQYDDNVVMALVR